MQMGQRHQPEEICDSGDNNFHEMGYIPRELKCALSAMVKAVVP